jgi:valyl-tRNA synthetase
MRSEYPKGIEQCGADALRWSLVQYTQQERQINMDVQRIISNRHFCNKIWQATKFTLNFKSSDRKGELGFVNEWILGRLNFTIEKVSCF